MTAPRRLTARQKRFAERYLVHLNATDAALEAGYARAARSRKTAAELGCQLLKKPQVRAEIEKLMAARSKRTEIRADVVLQELWRIATADVRELFAPDGSLIAIPDLSDVVAAAAGSVEFEEWRSDGEAGYVRTIRFRLHSKIGALELLGKHLGLFRDVVEHRGRLTLTKRIQSSRARVRAKRRRES